MANVAITNDAWTEISITSGAVQNISATADIELSSEQTDNSGVVLKPSEIYQWDNETIYARAVTESAGALRVVNFKKAAGGGGYVLPVASNSTLGGVKVGSNLSIDADGVLSATVGSGNPVGTIISYMGTTAPIDYLSCDGTTYNIADYQTLADHITAQFGAVDFFGGDGVSTFAVPDLRGEFLRGTGTNSHENQGSGENVGEHQDGTTVGDEVFFSNNTYAVRGDDNIKDSNGNYAPRHMDFYTCDNGKGLSFTGTSTTVTSPQVASYTSRPTNTSVLYCIKYQ